MRKDLVAAGPVLPNHQVSRRLAIGVYSEGRQQKKAHVCDLTGTHLPLCHAG